MKAKLFGERRRILSGLALAGLVLAMVLGTCDAPGKETEAAAEAPPATNTERWNARHASGIPDDAEGLIPFFCDMTADGGSHRLIYKTTPAGDIEWGLLFLFHGYQGRSPLGVYKETFAGGVTRRTRLDNAQITLELNAIEQTLIAECGKETYNKFYHMEEHPTPVEGSEPDDPFGSEDRGTEIKKDRKEMLRHMVEDYNASVLWTIASRIHGFRKAIGKPVPDHYDTALLNGQLASEGFRRCHRYVDGWLKLADPATGLLPRNRKDRYWNAKDAAADNYPFMVLTTFFTDRAMFEGRMKDMLRTETRLTSRIGSLPDTYDFARKGFPAGPPNLPDILFGASEYIKDGLLPLTEWLGPSPWSERMIAILDDMWQHAPVDTPSGRIVSTDVEVNGEMLQVLSRVYWLTGDRKYLEWALRLGDYYLLGQHHPTRDQQMLRLRDHGCEIVSGLCELYATVHFAMPDKQQEYSGPVHEMLDRILAVGRNQDGLFYNCINPISGTPVDKGIADTWGYTYNGVYTVYQIDGTKAYQEATRQALSRISRYPGYRWEGSSSDGYADSIESALNLYNREPVADAARWLDTEIKVMWGKQKSDGVIEGWHGDGNFARTTIMYCLWKTQGVYAQPWREDLRIGAVREDDILFVTLTADKDWEGKLYFDTPRHQTQMRLPVDWPRINQFPEWFTVDARKGYPLEDVLTGTSETLDGTRLRDGIPQSCKAGSVVELRIGPGMRN